MEIKSNTAAFPAQFSFVRTPQIVFGEGTFSNVPSLAAKYGKKAALITGTRSKELNPGWKSFLVAMESLGISVFEIQVTGEPTPEFVDSSAAELREKGIEVVISIGGGSVLDAGKATSAMLPVVGSVVEYLEGVGNPSKHPGTKIPMIAVPTTAGTGSETTKNAVLSRVGPMGFKRSLRHDNFVPDIAVVDPALTLTCPSNVTAACGMDALTQLLESFVSTKASPITDSLCQKALEAAGRSLPEVCGDGAGSIGHRSAMSYASMISGITLANAGLGVIHGMAAELGARFPIPHGVACGTLLVQATATTMRKLQQFHGPEHPALAKYALASELMFGRKAGADITQGCVTLIETLLSWLDRFEIPRLGKYGVTNADAKEIAAKTDNKNNPVALSAAEIEDILRRRI
jgi:alcohol dehydrogenase class IV